MNTGVVVRVPGKINLQLSVGPLKKTGFHEVATVFQAVSLFDDVTVKSGPPNVGIEIKISGENTDHIPVNQNNLAYKAAELMAKKYKVSTDLAIHLKKNIPVAGGMAGGSADAAGVIVGIDAIYNLGLKRDDMEKVGREIGSDVPFAISGGIAIGTGKGDQITPALSRGNYHWVLALSASGLSTPAVYNECDRLREGMSIIAPSVSEPLMQALRSGDANELGKTLSNDLQAAACSLRPALRLILDVGMDYGALGGLVSGSGPTVAFLAEDEEHSLDLIVALKTSGVVGNVLHVGGPVNGARVIETL
ncbi:4-diphosphocytidyl-2-C-methyl-D-erythritol kinase [Actinomycetes bacterium]|nr:4-diphosphocytidyl-2-C-methyl-D-erythritol kinase [Actinomycetes bacterium]